MKGRGPIVLSSPPLKSVGTKEREKTTSDGVRSGGAGARRGRKRGYRTSDRLRGRTLTMSSPGNPVGLQTKQGFRGGD